MRPRSSLALLAPALILAWSVGVLLPRTATAGCGCDHPPAGWAPLMPTFGSPGKPIRLNPPSGMEFLPGAPYLVTIGGVDVVVVAEHTTHLSTDVPAGAAVGPTQVHISGPDWTHQYAKTDFTVMAAAPMVPEQDGLFAVWDFEASISEDGTLMVPFNLSQVSEATQFLMVLKGLPLTFQQDDVVFYNADGIDLTLFTLMVDDPTQRQWGSYYGWDVEQDRGFKRRVYKKKIMGWLGSTFSDQITYWRHEFLTYKAAHAPGGTHEVDPTGYHTGDGTLHVDHDHLVLAVSGKLRDATKPPEQWNALSPGKEKVDVFVMTIQSENPLEPHEVMAQLTASMGANAYVLMSKEAIHAYRHGD